MRILVLGLTLALFAVSMVGCSAEKAQEQAADQKTITMDAGAQEKVRQFLMEMTAITALPDKTFSLVTQELMVLVSGGWNATRLTGLMESAGKEVEDMARRLAAIAVPEGIPPELKQQLQSLKEGVIKAGQLKGESLATLKRSVEEKKPAVLLEFRKTMSEAAKQLEEMRQKMKAIQSNTGITI